MGEWLSIVDKYGVPLAMLAAILFVLWRGGREAGRHLVRWADQLMSHWIESSKDRDLALKKLLEVHAQHELSEERRHHDDVERVNAMSTKLEEVLTEAITDIATSIGLMVTRESADTREDVAEYAKRIVRIIREERAHRTGVPYVSDGESTDLAVKKGEEPGRT